MRLINYINEERQLKFSVKKDFELSDPQIIIIKKFEKNTKPWFDYCNKQGVKNKFLWRGNNYIVRSFIKRKTRKNREPTDTCFCIHNLADVYFKKYYGVKARSQSLFCFSSKKAAKRYGKSPDIIIPSGKFSYIWSPKIKDFFEHIELTEFYANIYNIEGDDYEYLWDYYEKEYDEDKKGTWFYNNKDTKEKYKDNAREKIYQQMKKSGEISNDKNFIDYYDYIENRLEWFPDLEFEDYVQKKLSEAKKELKNFIKNNYIKNKRFKDLMDDTSYYKNEVMLQCNEYYLVNEDWAKENLESII